jgi:DNA polymerase bacteriophage-type
VRKVHLDFESRSTQSIWDVGAANYAAHASTEVLCLAYAVDDGEVKLIKRNDILCYPMGDPFVELRELAKDKDTLFYAHNALFEQLIWLYKMQEPFNLPRLPINRWRCTAAKAQAVGLPKALQDVALALGTTQQKDHAGKAIMLKMCKPRGWNGDTPVYYEDDDLMDRLEAYCKQDVLTEREIDDVLPELAPFEQYVWFEDQLINQRGVCVDVDLVKTILKYIAFEEERLKKEVAVLSDNKLEGVSRRQAVLDYIKSQGVVLPDFQKATIQRYLDEHKMPQHIVDILRIRQQLGLTSVAKYDALKTAVTSNGRLKDTFVYHSASTGRWGGKLVQLQNLPRGNFDSTEGVAMIKGYDYETLRVLYPNLMELFSSCVRGMFIADKGKDLIVADYNAIEARVLMWFCGETEAVEMFEQGKDIYVAMAKRIGQGATRQLGKQAILGCGYGMGAVKFKATCANYGINIDDMLADTAVRAYRETYSKVKSTWYAVERAAIAAIKGVPTRVCGVTWFMQGAFLWCKLPSGRCLAYHKPALKANDYGQEITYMTTDSYTKKYTRKNTYGGALIENIIQAIARDILAYGMLNAEKSGYKVVMHVHDEIVVETDEGAGSVDGFVNLICHTPDWAKGCPIKAEGWRGKRYKK